MKLLLTAMVIAVMSGAIMCGAAAEIAPSASAPPALPPAFPAVELVKGIAWPLAALVIAIGFRQPIALFMNALGGRITKLAVFKVELERVPATAVTTTPLLDDIRTATNSATISDSSRTMIEQVQSGTPADFAVVSLGGGAEWLTSRLYIAAVMMERMRGVKVFVFVERAPNTERRFVAVASLRQLRWALARRYPWLEAAWARVQLSPFPQALPPSPPTLPAGAQWLPDPRTLSVPQPVIQSDNGALDPWQARMAVSGFIDLLQRQCPAGPSDAEWITLYGTTQERAAWVTRDLLSSLLPPEAFNAWAHAMRDAPRVQLTRSVLRRAAAFVALVEGDREFVRLTNRQVLLEDIAASLGEEPEHN